MRHPKCLALSLAIVSVASVGHSQQIVGRNDRVFTLTERVPTGGAVRVFSSMGEITVTEGTGGSLEYRAEKERGDADDVGFVVLRGADGITICAIYDEDDECRASGIQQHRNGWRNSRNRARAIITVSVPRAVKLVVGSGNGAVSVAAAASEASVSSGNGRVRVSRVTGRVRASSGNGTVTIESVGGPVDVSSGNGDIHVTATNGPINASSGNGDIIVSMDRLTGNDDLEFSSGNGRIELTVPDDFSAEIEASTGSGRVSTDFPIRLVGRIQPSRLRGTIGNGGRLVRMTSGNGSMEIRKK